MEPGDNVTLVCTVEGYPLPAVTWLRNGEPISSPDSGSSTDFGYELEKRVVNGLLTGPPFAEVSLFIYNDIETAVFQCDAINDLARTSESREVKVMGPGTSPTIREMDLHDDNSLTVTWTAPEITNGDITV